jgi:hypothetical protein
MKVCVVEGCEKKSIGFGYCSKHYTRLKRYGDVNYPGKKGGQRTKKIDFEVIRDCFVLTSHKVNVDGYAEIMINRRAKKIHRHIYEQCFGEIPAGLVIRHKCDNPSCINPEHLEVGTIQDNVADMISRNRQAKGSKKPISKLKEEQVLEIKIMIKQGIPNVSIADKFNVHSSVISNIKHNRLWKHVKEEIK